jgi:hypothetical protein
MAFLILVGSHFSVFVFAEAEGILLWLGVAVIFGWDDFSIHCVCFVTFITYCAAFFAFAGVVSSRCRSRISSAVSISSSRIVVSVGAAVFRVCLVGGTSLLVYG